MKIERVIVGLAINVNTGPYESIKPNVQFEATLEESEDVERATAELHDRVERSIAIDLISVAAHDLENIALDDVDPNDHMRYAQERSSAFRWLCIISPVSAADVLAERLDDTTPGWTGINGSDQDGGAEGGLPAPGETLSDIPF